ncbi:MAG: GNAT family N-acetyltransferase [Candidatus Brockarchaeota archaeon]|nr:GNAT family N-acetyltransferase [Candidatus Brockarchaeota archaeon]
MDVAVKESRDLDKVVGLFEQHKDSPFTYLTNIPLVKMLSQLESFKIFVAEVDGETVGCIHSLSYIYDCGYVGGLLVHKDFRRKGIGSRLLDAALNSLNTRYVYLFVEEKNTAAVRLVEKTGFKRIYKGRRYIVSTQLDEASGALRITNDVDWASLKESIGFKERNGAVNLGYYPVKMTEKAFEDLRASNRIIRCGSVIAIIENSYGLTIGDHLYAFNDHIVRSLRCVDTSRRIVEVNPFYTKPRLSDLINMVNYLVSLGEVHVKTYDGDPVASRLPLTGRIGALTMEYEKQGFNMF